MDTPPADFQALYTAFQPRIRRYVARLAGEAEADDLTQEVFIKVNAAQATFRGEAQLATWLYRIATNAVIDRLRSATFRQEAEHSDLEDSEETEAAAPWTGAAPATPEQQWMHQEMIECFANFVDRLPVSYRTVFVLSDLEELPNSEIADILGVSVETVKIRLHRGRARLFQELKAHCKPEDWL